MPDNVDGISFELRRLCDQLELAGGGVALTTGGTGFAPRDVTPEATRTVVDRLAPAFGEAMVCMMPRRVIHSTAVSGCDKFLISPFNLTSSQIRSTEKYQPTFACVSRGIVGLRGSVIATLLCLL